MTGFLLTAKQKLMLCINKRLYRSHRPDWRYGYRCDWPHRRNRSYWPHRADWRNRSYWSHWPNWRYGYRRNRSYWSHWSDRCYGCRCDWAYRSHRPDRRYWSYGSHGCNRPNR